MQAQDYRAIATMLNNCPDALATANVESLVGLFADLDPTFDAVAFRTAVYADHEVPLPGWGELTVALALRQRDENPLHHCGAISLAFEEGSFDPGDVKVLPDLDDAVWVAQRLEGGTWVATSAESARVEFMARRLVFDELGALDAFASWRAWAVESESARLVLPVFVCIGDILEVGDADHQGGCDGIVYATDDSDEARLQAVLADFQAWNEGYGYYWILRDGDGALVCFREGYDMPEDAWVAGAAERERLLALRPQAVADYLAGRKWITAAGYAQ